MDLRQSKAYANYQKSRGWEIEKIGTSGERGAYLFIKKMPVLGVSVLKGQRYKGSLNWKELGRAKKANRVIYTVLEPLEEKEQLRERGFKVNASPYLPTETVVVDLSKDFNELWEGLAKDAQRTIEKSEVKIRSVEGKEERKRFWRKWKRASQIYIPNWQSFEKLRRSFKENIWVKAAYSKGGMIAGTVILLAGRRGFYYYAWTDQAGRKLGGQYKLVWKVMEELKEQGVKNFDLEGIEDERWPRKSWRGFSFFKKKFGGERVRFGESFIKWF